MCSVRKVERKKVQTLVICFWSTMEHTNWAQKLKALLNEFSLPTEFCILPKQYQAPRKYYPSRKDLVSYSSYVFKWY